MHVLDLQIAAIAARQDNLFTRSDVFACGGSQKAIVVRLESGRWQQIHPGVYLIGAAPPTWLQLVRSGVLAAGEDAQASHRCGLVVWGADGLRAAPVEIVVPYLDGPAPRGVIVHRSRRVEPTSVVGGIPVTSIERTLLESATVTPSVVTEKAFAWAWRRGLTTPEKCDRYLELHGGKGRRGTTRLRRMVELYAGTGRPPGSDGEVVFLRCLREAGIEGARAPAPDRSSRRRQGHGGLRLAAAAEGHRVRRARSPRRQSGACRRHAPGGSGAP